MEIDYEGQESATQVPLLTRRRAVNLNQSAADEPSIVRTEKTFYDEASGTETVEDLSLQPLGCGHVAGLSGSVTLSGVCHTCRATLCTSCAIKNACLRCKKLCCPSHGKTIKRQSWYCRRCW